MPAQVFISYSSRDAAAVALREALGKALEKVGYEVFIDNWSITPGEEWGQKIRVGLAESHAAIILFSKSTVDHDFVLYEAGILSIRCHLDDYFKLIPVLFGEVKQEDLRSQRFSPLAIDVIQNITVSSEQQIVDKILELLGPASGRVGHKTIVGSLADQIAVELGEFQDLRLKQLAAWLGLNIAIWDRQVGIASIATELTRRVLGEGMAGVEQSIRTLVKARATGLKPLVDLLAPLWVRHEAAGMIPQAPRQMVALNGLFFADFTARMYLLRAVWPAPDIEVCPVSETDSEDRVTHVADEIAKYLMATRPIFKKPQQALDYLKRRKPALYVTLPAPVPSPEELEQLSADFPSVTFLLHTGERALTTTQLPTLVEPLPELTPKEEQDACDLYGNILGLLSVQGG